MTEPATPKNGSSSEASVASAPPCSSFLEHVMHVLRGG
jgi:hypothetical protein